MLLAVGIIGIIVGLTFLVTYRWHKNDGTLMAGIIAFLAGIPLTILEIF